ncbi:MAG: M57 family metalloprotease [Bacteroidota bacterium]
MKKIFALAAFAALLISLNGCAKKDQTTLVSTADQELSQDIKAKIKALGFSSDDAYTADGGYIVEGDIFLTDADLNTVDPIQSLIVGNTEQYHTTNLVTGLPRNITVRYSGSNTNLSNAVNAAIARYNAQGLQITFSRVTSGGNIVVTTVNSASYIASSGFPSAGNPYNSVKYNLQYTNIGANTMASVMAHEIGHCIGFRHTDYMDRSYSCGGAYTNEGSAGVGAILIPGTPSTADPNSWMLACIGNGVDRPFNANDIVALNYIY